MTSQRLDRNPYPATRQGVRDLSGLRPSDQVHQTSHGDARTVVPGHAVGYHAVAPFERPHSDPDHDSLYLRFEQLEAHLAELRDRFVDPSIDAIGDLIGLIRGQVIR